MPLPLPLPLPLSYIPIPAFSVSVGPEDMSTHRFFPCGTVPPRKAIVHNAATVLDITDMKWWGLGGDYLSCSRAHAPTRPHARTHVCTGTVASGRESPRNPV